MLDETTGPGTVARKIVDNQRKAGSVSAEIKLPSDELTLLIFVFASCSHDDSKIWDSPIRDP